MKTIKIIAAISFFVLVIISFSAASFAQTNNTKSFMYYVNIHLAAKQQVGVQYRIEIMDQYGWRVLPPKNSLPGEHMYVFQETVPSSVTGFRRVAHIIILGKDPAAHYVFRTLSDKRNVSAPGNYYFNFYPNTVETNPVAEQK